MCLVSMLTCVVLCRVWLGLVTHVRGYPAHRHGSCQVPKDPQLYKTEYENKHPRPQFSETLHTK